MNRLRTRWAGIGGRERGLTVAGIFACLAALVIVIVVALQPAPPVASVATPSPPPPTAPASASPSASLAATASPGPSATAAPADLLGADGRFTVLLLGSDFRQASPGNRTDTIMIVSVAPPDGSVSVISIPRDTARFPLAGGTVWSDKINGLYASTVRKVGVDAAGGVYRQMLGATLGVEIDAYAFVGMRGLVELIDSIGGVDVVLAKPVRDRVYWTNDGVQGIYFPAGKNHLDGERALIFARTRKGDSDFSRIRRQQQLVQATAEKVAERGLGALPALLALGEEWVRTDLPLDRALEIFALVANADTADARTAVLGPRFADKIPDSVNYELRMDEVRELVAEWFAPLPGSLLGPPASPAPGASPSSTP